MHRGTFGEPGVIIMKFAMSSSAAMHVLSLLAVLPIAGASSLVAQDDAVASDRAEVLAAAESFLSAFSNLEWDRFYSSFAPSATVFLPFREPWRKEDREEAAAFFQSLFDQVRAAAEGPPSGKIVPEDLRIEMLGDAAVVTFHLPGAGSVGRRTLVFGRDAPEGPWRIVHLHASVQQLPERPDGEDNGGEAPSADGS